MRISRHQDKISGADNQQRRHQDRSCKDQDHQELNYSKARERCMCVCRVLQFLLTLYTEFLEDRWSS